MLAATWRCCKRAFVSIKDSAEGGDPAPQGEMIQAAVGSFRFAACYGDARLSRARIFMPAQASDELVIRLRRINALASFLFLVFIAIAALGIAVAAGFLGTL
jgi:hypothetical protein